MNTWAEHGLEDKVVQVLKSAPANPSGHGFGRPYLSPYQLAIALNKQFPDTVEDIGLPLGGAGIGQRNSLAQLLAAGLRRHIEKHGDAYPIECAYLSNVFVKELSYRGPDGLVRSSLPEGGLDMTIFRAR